MATFKETLKRTNQHSFHYLTEGSKMLDRATTISGMVVGMIGLAVMPEIAAPAFLAAGIGFTSLYFKNNWPKIRKHNLSK